MTQFVRLTIKMSSFSQTRVKYLIFLAACERTE